MKFYFSAFLIICLCNLCVDYYWLWDVLNGAKVTHLNSQVFIDNGREIYHVKNARFE